MVAWNCSNIAWRFRSGFRRGFRDVSQRQGLVVLWERDPHCNSIPRSHGRSFVMINVHNVLLSLLTTFFLCEENNVVFKSSGQSLIFLWLLGFDGFRKKVSFCWQLVEPEGGHWMLPSSTIIYYDPHATFRHYCEDIPSGSHLIQGTGAACKLRPSQKPTSPTLLHPRHPLARFSVCLFFPSASIDGPLVVCWCGGAETPGPYWLRGGWWRRRDPETENPRAAPHLPPPRPLDLPTDQMQPPGPPASTTPNM